MRRKGLIVAALAILLVGGLIAVLRRPNEQERVHAIAATSITPEAPSAARALVSPQGSQAQVTIGGWRESVTDERLFTRFNKRSMNSLELVAYEVLQSNRDLAVFSYFHRKGLLSSEERAHYHALLSDRDMLAAAKNEILFSDEQSSKDHDKVRRLMNTDLIKEAAIWLENPIREEVLRTVEEIIEHNNFSAHLDRDILASLATNKLELMEILYESAPHRATQLVTRNEGTEMGPLLGHLMAELHKKKELELANEPSSARREKSIP